MHTEHTVIFIPVFDIKKIIIERQLTHSLIT